MLLCGGTARILRYHNTDIEIEADAPGGGFVVLNDVWHPWWRASVDGKPAEILKANVLFRAVVVPPGKHVVRFTFHPFAGAVAELKGMVSAFVALKSRKIMSGALVLWRDGTVRPAHSSAALAPLKYITGICVHAGAVLGAPADLRHVGIALGHEHRAQRRERPIRARSARSSATSSTMRS